MLDVTMLAYAIPALPIWLTYRSRRRSAEKRHLSILEDAREAGLTEPNSLHPVIDTVKCIGCSACILACPEGEVLGLVDGKATLIDPTSCIGHGACQEACPAGAIDLVFGTATRGIDIPFVKPDFQTNVPGIYLAGEIGGMGLIRNAIKQGCEAVEAIADAARTDEASDPGMLDLLIVGAGPAGIAASLSAMEQGLRFTTVEQDSLGGTVAHYPRNKLVMTAPATLPIYGELRFREIKKEALLDIWRDVVAKTGLEVRYQERVLNVEPVEGGFCVQTSGQIYRARRILLAIGRRGTPRELGVAGEDRSNVVYRLVDPAQYRDRRVLVIGGGDSALEAALALIEEDDADVTLCYRGDAFARARRQNRDSLFIAAEQGRVQILLNSSVKAIENERVMIECRDRTVALPNDDVIICAGGVLPTSFLKSVGIAFERKFGTI